MKKLKFEDIVKLLQEYKEQNGDCLVPYLYITEDGVRLGHIVYRIRRGIRKTNADEKAMLNNLGFVWKIRKDILPFEELIRLLQEYKEQYGDFLVPRAYTTEDGVALGSIVNNIRTGARKTNADEKAMLNSLGFVWKTKKDILSIEEVIRLLQKYKEQYGDFLVPRAYTTEDGVALGSIVNNIRTGARKTNTYEKAMLNSLGFVWKTKERLSKIPFEEVIRLLKEYKEQYGDCFVPGRYITKDGVQLGWLVSNIRRGNRKTNAEEKAKLNSLGFVWKIRKDKLSIEEVTRLLQEYKAKNGNCVVPKSYITENGVHLGCIVQNIRSGARKTNAEEKAKLNSLGFVWRVERN